MQYFIYLLTEHVEVHGSQEGGGRRRATEERPREGWQGESTGCGPEPRRSPLLLGHVKAIAYRAGVHHGDKGNMFYTLVKYVCRG